jgi:hypothetical protein
MIDVLKGAAIHTAVNGFCVAQFNDVDPLLSLDSLFYLGDGDSLSGVFTDFLPRTNGTIGVEARSLDTTLSND